METTFLKALIEFTKACSVDIFYQPKNIEKLPSEILSVYFSTEFSNLLQKEGLEKFMVDLLLFQMSKEDLVEVQLNQSTSSSVPSLYKYLIDKGRLINFLYDIRHLVPRLQN